MRDQNIKATLGDPGGTGEFIGITAWPALVQGGSTSIFQNHNMQADSFKVDAKHAVANLGCCLG